jgi:IS5 family transposase
VARKPVDDDFFVQVPIGQIQDPGMKAHIGVDAASSLVHTVIGTAGNVADVTQAHALLHGGEIAALGDAGYQGVEKRPENIGKTVTWHVAMKRSKR